MPDGLATRNLASDASRRTLAGKRVLLVEDEDLLAEMLEDFLLDFGCEVAGTAGTFEDAVTQAKTLRFDVAILDVYLDEEQTYPIAEFLVGRLIPFVFVTGHAAAEPPPHLQGAPLLRKPFKQRDLENALLSVLGSAV